MYICIPTFFGGLQRKAQLGTPARSHVVCDGHIHEGREGVQCLLVISQKG